MVVGAQVSTTSNLPAWGRPQTLAWRTPRPQLIDKEIEMREGKWMKGFFIHRCCVPGTRQMPGVSEDSHARGIVTLYHSSREVGRTRPVPRTC